jgi:A nuclease family of the HNH/ENDO VII superfamily with conserved AHH
VAKSFSGSSLQSGHVGNISGTVRLSTAPFTERGFETTKTCYEGVTVAEHEAHGKGKRAMMRWSLIASRAGWHRHHIVPRQITRFADLRTFVQRLALTGFSLDDFAKNGLFLPSEEAVAVRHKLPLHRGAHRLYNEIVIDRLHHLDLRAKRNKCPDADTLRAVRWLQRQLACSLSAAGRNDQLVVLSGRDPFGQTPLLDALDRMTDELLDRQTTETTATQMSANR